MTWSSSNPAVATVDESGFISALSQGTTTISITTNDSTDAITIDAIGVDKSILDGQSSIWDADNSAGYVLNYNDNNPTINGEYVGATIYLKGDGADMNAMFQTDVFNGKQFSASQGFYVGSVFARTTTTQNSTQVIDASGNWVGNVISSTKIPETRYVFTNPQSTTTDLDTRYRAEMFAWSPSSTGTKPASDYGQGISIVSSGHEHNDSTNWITQLGFGTDKNSGFFRTKVNGDAWGSWNTLLHSGNFASSHVAGVDYNAVIGTDSDIVTSGATIVDDIYMTDGVITSHTTRTLTLGNLGYTGDTNAEENQMAFSSVLVGSTSMNATTKTDILNIIAGSNITLDADATGNNLTINSVFTDTQYIAGGGLVLVGNEFSHANTSSVANVSTSGATIIDDLTFDTYGHVTGATTRSLTLANLGYTGDANANNYIHPSYAGDDINIDTGALSGANVISDLDFNITTDSLGHVTDANAVVSTRALTLTDLGLNQNRIPYAFSDAGGNGAYGSTNTTILDGGIGSDNIRRSMFYRDNADFGRIGVHMSHATNPNYALQLATTSYTTMGTLKYRLLSNGSWTTPTAIIDDTNKTTYISKTYIDSLNVNADTLDGEHGSHYLNYNNLTNKPTIGDATITISAGGGMSGGGNLTTNQTSNETITISHADTSAQPSVDNSDGNVIQDVFVDDYGHITGMNSTNLDTRFLKKSGDTATGIMTFDNDVFLNGDSYGLYHRIENNKYYFDDHNGHRNLNIFYKNSKSDIIRYQPIVNPEYWNGTSWADMSSQLANVQKLLDGRQDTSWAVPSTYYKFRFEVTASTGYPLMSMFWIQTAWSGSTFPECQMIVDEWDGANWVQKVVCDFSNANGVDGWGLMARANHTLHTGDTDLRITIDFEGWTPSNPSHTTIPLQNIMITSQFSGSDNTDYSNLLDYNKDVTLPSRLRITQVDTNTSSLQTLVMNGTEVEKRTMSLSALGYTGDTDANNYVHPSYAGDDINLDTGALTGAVVISDLDFNVTTDSLGHVTDANATYATRTLTLAHLGYLGDTNAQANQNAFSVIAVSGQGSVSADNQTDTLTLVAGSNVSITTNATNDSVTINATYTDTTYIAGGGLVLVGDEFSHANTSSVGNITTSGATIVDDLTFDTYGHVTGATTRTLTLADLGYTGDTNAEVNQNAFSNIQVGPSTLVADSKTDTLYIVGEWGISTTGFSGTDTLQIRLNGDEIPSGADLNTYRTTGVFSQDSNADATAGSNYPTNQAGILEVIKNDYGNGIHVIQRYSQYSSINVYHRYYYNGSWSAWRNLSQNTDTTYSGGSGINLIGTTISHADTSSVSAITTSGATIISGLTFDTYGHVFSRTTRTLTTDDIGAVGITGSQTITGFKTFNDGLTMNATDSGFGRYIRANIGNSTTASTNKAGFIVSELGSDRYGMYYTRDGLGKIWHNIYGTQTWGFQRNGLEVMTLDSSNHFTFANNVTADNFILSSDEKLKENIEDVDVGLINVDWKTFNMKNDPTKSKRYGVIAQELEKKHPEFVEENENGFKAVKYIDLLIAKVAELETRIKELEGK